MRRAGYILIAVSLLAVVVTIASRVGGDDEPTAEPIPPSSAPTIPVPVSAPPAESCQAFDQVALLLGQTIAGFEQAIATNDQAAINGAIDGVLERRAAADAAGRRLVASVPPVLRADTATVVAGLNQALAEIGTIDRAAPVDQVVGEIQRIGSEVLNDPAVGETLRRVRAYFRTCNAG